MILKRTTQLTAKQDADPDDEVELLARAEHLRVIFKNAPLLLLANLAAGVTLSIGLWSVVPRDRLLSWLGVMLLVQLTRQALTRDIAGMPPEAATIQRQESFLIIATFVSGTIWGSAALLFYVPHQAAANMFLALILIAMSAAATAVLSFHRYAYPVFLAPVILPLGIRFATEDGLSQLTVALVIPVYFSLLFALSRQIYGFVHEAILTALVRERHALIDPLTAIANRRAFEESLQKEWSRGLRTRRPLTLILCDIDKFKVYNDNFGHAVGDAALRLVASLVRQAARREIDLATRIGGDEFAILAPETDRVGASNIVARIERSRELLAQNTATEWPFPTLSIGWCTVVPSDATSPFALFEEADAALYEAKAAGRHRVAACNGTSDYQ